MPKSPNSLHIHHRKSLNCNPSSFPPSNLLLPSLKSLTKLPRNSNPSRIHLEQSSKHPKIKILQFGFKAITPTSPKTGSHSLECKFYIAQNPSKSLFTPRICSNGTSGFVPEEALVDAHSQAQAVRLSLRFSGPLVVKVAVLSFYSP